VKDIIIRKMLILLLIFSIFSPCLNQNKVVAAGTWKKVATEDTMAEREDEIKYIYEGKAAYFAQEGGVGEYNNSAGIDSSIAPKASSWFSKKTPYGVSTFNIIVDESIVPNKVIDICFSTNGPSNLYTNTQTNYIIYSRKWNLWMNNDNRVDYRCAKHADADWGTRSLPYLYAVDTEMYKIAKNVWEDVRSGNNTIAEVPRSSAPLATSIEACSKEEITPIFDGGSSAEIDEFYKSMKENLINSMKDPVTGKGDAEDELFVGKFFDNIGKITPKVKEFDREVYSIFYGEKGKKYPTVALTGNVFQKYNDFFHEAELKRPQGIETEGAARIIRTVGASIASVPGALAGSAVGGPILGGAMGLALGGSVIAWDEIRVNAEQESSWYEFLPYLIKIQLATYYVNANNKINKCYASKNDPYAVVNNSVTELITGLTQEAIDTAGGSTNNNASSVCDTISGHTMIGDALYKAFCNLALALQDWAKSFLDMAFCYLRTSLGYASSKTSDWSSCKSYTSQ
jgi:hypothetical protein